MTYIPAPSKSFLRFYFEAGSFQVPGLLYNLRPPALVSEWQGLGGRTVWLPPSPHGAPTSPSLIGRKSRYCPASGTATAALPRGLLALSLR